MLHQTEPNANNALALVIRGMLPSCTVLPETTQVFPDHPGRHTRRSALAVRPAAVAGHSSPTVTLNTYLVLTPDTLGDINEVTEHIMCEPERLPTSAPVDPFAAR